ncbi:MAG: 30S ribosome-binding factor RbfA [Verrucomicrobia bacterium]|nr:30S ribosome-binding factor RbfA [Verrucomicrobiota bacterium]
MSLRLLRVCELIKRELGVIIGREIKFEAPLVSVRAVDITPDLKNAHVFISAIGTKWQKEQAIQQLEVQRQHLQHELSRRVILKYTPLLHFQLDESIERGTRVLNLLDEIEPTLLPDESPNNGGVNDRGPDGDKTDYGDDAR